MHLILSELIFLIKKYTCMVAQVLSMKTLKYLQVTDEGKSWVASLNYHVFSQSHKAELEKSGIELMAEIKKINPKDFSVGDFISLILGKICDY